MGQLKELMILHMTSPNDAFRFVSNQLIQIFHKPKRRLHIHGCFLFSQFDLERDNTLTFNDFSKLVTQAHKLGGAEIPAYTVIKDLFDLVDIRKDGIVDLQEWQQTFGAVTGGSRSNSIK